MLPACLIVGRKLLKGGGCGRGSHSGQWRRLFGTHAVLGLSVLGATGESWWRGHVWRSPQGQWRLEAGGLRIAWCRAWMPKGRLAFVVTCGFMGFSNLMQSHFGYLALFFFWPQSVVNHKNPLPHPTADPFPNLAHISRALYSHIQQIKTNQFCFPFSQRIAERDLQITSFASMRVLAGSIYIAVFSIRVAL